MASTIGRLIASLFSFFREKFSVNNRNMAQESVSEEAVQEALLRLSGITDFAALRETIRDAIGCTLPGLGDLVIYVQDMSSGVDLISIDGLAGAQHTLPKTGIAGKCLDKRTRLLVNGLSADDPLSGLLPSSSSPLPANRKVLCSPVIDKENQRIVCVIVAVCDNPSSAHEKCFSLLEKHIAVCIHRLQQQQGQNNNRRDSASSLTARAKSATAASPTSWSSSAATAGLHGDTHRRKDDILALCADLHDNDAASMQLKVIRYLEKQTQSECCTLLVVSEESSELFCQVLGNKVLDEEIRFMTGTPMCKYEIPCCCFNQVLTSKKSMMLKDIQQSDRQELTKKLGIAIHSMMCVPVINQATSNVVAVACAINKINGQGYCQQDEDVIRHCFRYTVPVLTSVLALQKETQLKQETQSMLQVAKNLFTHLGEFCDTAEKWRRHPPELSDLGANIDLHAIPPSDKKEDEREFSDKKDESGSGHGSPVELSCSESSLEKVVDSFTVQAEDGHSSEVEEGEEEELQNNISPPGSLKKAERRKWREKMSAPYTIPKSPEEKQKMRRQARPVRRLEDKWYDASSEDIRVEDIPLKGDDIPGDQRGDDQELYQDNDVFEDPRPQWLQEIEKDILDDIEELRGGDMEQDTLEALRAMQEYDEELQARALALSGVLEDLDNPFQENDNDNEEEFLEATGGEDISQHLQEESSVASHTDVSSWPDLNTRDSWGNVIFRSPISITVTGPTPEQSPSRSKQQIQWYRSSSGLGIYTSRRNPFPTDSQCGMELIRRHSSRVLELDWSCATLSVHCVPNPPGAHLEDPYDVRILLREIMQEARNLTQAERCSLFLVENDELVAKVFDGHVLDEMGEVRIPITQGIAGHVATTGKILNILDAYSHPLFYRGVDDSTGFRTRNILCFPIKDRSSDKSERKNDAVVGIAELCNKTNGLYFTKHDEEVAAAFSIYCGISIVHSLLCKKMKDAQYRSKLANELMMYHMKVGEDESPDVIRSNKIPSPASFHPEFAKFTYSPRGIPESETVSAVMTMFDDMGMINRWRINKKTLWHFIVLVRRGYRDPPYHNWYHAFSVGHFCYLLYKNIFKLNMLGDIEVFSLVVAAICHDLDHRGTNNSFQVHSQSVLAALYSSEGSVMERHHFAQAMCILNTEGCNIFENLSREEYQHALDLVQEIILATDLAHHLRIVKELRKMAKDGYNANDPKCHKLLLCLLMTSADLSDQTKGWTTTKRIAELIYREFFTQGDLEKAMGLETPEMYDREKACIPELQINFLDHIAMPVYEILYELFPSAKELVDGVEANKLMWVHLRHETKRRKLSSTNSLDFFRVPFTCEAEHINGLGSTVSVLEEQDEESTSSKNGDDPTRI